MDPNNLPPLRLNFYENDHSMVSQSLPSRYLIRQIGSAWYQLMENMYPNAAVGTRILVRRDITAHPTFPGQIIHDYITVRTNQQTLYDQWIHVQVAYPSNENSPYPFDIDGYHNREEMFRIPPPQLAQELPQEDSLSSSQLLS